MIAGSQRWRHGRDRYRPPGEVIRPADYEVAEIPDDTTAKRFVVEHHYSRAYVVARVRVGLYRHGVLVGVCVFSQPCNQRTLANVFGDRARDCAELGRLVILDSEQHNAESFFVARAFAILRRRGFAGVLSFSDPVPRVTAEGHTVCPGHVGYVYQSLNARYLGRGTPRTLRLLPDGRVFNDRAAQKIRSEDRGWRYAARILEQHGADPPRGDLRSWLDLWVPRLTRAVRHAGNHRYAWALDRHAQVSLVTARPYPKQRDPAPVFAPSVEIPAARLA